MLKALIGNSIHGIFADISYFNLDENFGFAMTKSPINLLYSPPNIAFKGWNDGKLLVISGRTFELDIHSEKFEFSMDFGDFSDDVTQHCYVQFRNFLVEKIELLHFNYKDIDTPYGILISGTFDFKVLISINHPEGFLQFSTSKSFIRDFLENHYFGKRIIKTEVSSLDT